MSINFERNLVTNESIPGTKMSAKGMQLMVSTGIPSVDRFLGGGLPLNSITLIEEDSFGQYSSLMAKCFVSEAIDSNQKTIICSETIVSKKSRLIKELPIRSTQTPKQWDTPSDDIQIAWRYKSQPLVANSLMANESHFDLSSHLTESALNSADIEFCSHNSCLDFISSLKPKDTQSVTRILIEGLGSPLSPITIDCLTQFVYKLKSLVRKIPNVLCLMTFSAQLALQSNTPHVRSRVHNIVDGVIQLIGFDERTVTPYTEYEGLFNIIKLPKLNTFNNYSTLETLDLGFQLKNKTRFLTVDKLCLPPDLSDDVSRTTGCGTHSTSGPSLKNLEF